jgi:ribosomal protein S17E
MVPKLEKDGAQKNFRLILSFTKKKNLNEILVNRYAPPKHNNQLKKIAGYLFHSCNKTKYNICRN